MCFKELWLIPSAEFVLSITGGEEKRDPLATLLSLVSLSALGHGHTFPSQLFGEAENEMAKGLLDRRALIKPLESCPLGTR